MGVLLLQLNIKFGGYRALGIVNVVLLLQNQITSHAFHVFLTTLGAAGTTLPTPNPGGKRILVMLLRNWDIWVQSCQQ